MKKSILVITICSFMVMMMTSCSLFKGKAKYGCPTNGKNVGAEKLVSGDPASAKAARKARKFKS